MTVLLWTLLCALSVGFCRPCYCWLPFMTITCHRGTVCPYTTRRSWGVGEVPKLYIKGRATWRLTTIPSNHPWASRQWMSSNLSIASLRALPRCK
ncbi:hypothetical protein DFH94DRAFT_777612 [Russula ochroleuca]|uniref:Secreted protein n=1 Tax=Russula ochroleuca TaxID=152965 RepID=A0A9P5JWV6_9AGAM|nr:hypothetical protein DFH94DRAFT_777612 [Russula ochroleuca]